jgi:hypothetical protein
MYKVLDLIPSTTNKYVNRSSLISRIIPSGLSYIGKGRKDRKIFEERIAETFQNVMKTIFHLSKKFNGSEAEKKLIKKPWKKERRKKGR